MARAAGRRCASDNAPLRVRRVQVFPRRFRRRWRNACTRRELPVPGYDTVCEDLEVRTILDSVLSDEGIALSDLRVRNMHRIHVGGVPRAAVVIPEDLSVGAPETDELSTGKHKLVLRFFLARGSYATILLKRLTLPQ